MAKGGSGLAASVWKARRSALNSAAPWPEPEAAQARVLGIQRKLHRWAEDDQDRRFTDLHNLVCDAATLMVAWQRVRANRGSRSGGVDRQNAYDVEQRLGVEQFLGGLREELRTGSFRPVSVRERLIPKRGGKLRRAGNSDGPRPCRAGGPQAGAGADLRCVLEKAVVDLPVKVRPG
jgi:retron-type reverse transcriptase